MAEPIIGKLDIDKTVRGLFYRRVDFLIEAGIKEWTRDWELHAKIPKLVY